MPNLTRTASGEPAVAAAVRHDPVGDVPARGEPGTPEIFAVPSTGAICVRARFFTRRIAQEDQVHQRKLLVRALGTMSLVWVLSGCSCMFGERRDGSCAGPMGSLDNLLEYADLSAPSPAQPVDFGHTVWRRRLDESA